MLVCTYKANLPNVICYAVFIVMASIYNNDKHTAADIADQPDLLL